MENQKLRGMTGFSVVWVGQLISLTGSAMTQFALTYWVFEKTGQATTLTLMILFNFGPTILLSPIAGALVDRWNRKLVMMLSDLAAGVTTIAIFMLVRQDALELWHLYALGALAGAFQAFQFPAYSAAITMMIDKKHYARAHGMLATAQSASGIGAPIIAAGLLGIIGIEGIMTIDIITFTAAIGALLLVPIPQPKQTAEGAAGSGNLLREAGYGFQYIWERKPLLGLQMNFFAANLMGALALPIIPAMILARTGNNELALGTVQTMMGIGGFVGGLLMSAWGGPKRRIHGVLLGICFFGLSRTIVGVGQGIVLWSVGSFLTLFFLPILNGSNQAIWQAKVAPDVQGRVFSVRRLIAQITFPLGLIIAGPLSDFVLEPTMLPGGALAGVFGPILGTGPGAGMSVLILVSGVIGALIALLGYAFPVIRNAESLLPDHEAIAEDDPVSDSLQGEAAPEAAPAR